MSYPPVLSAFRQKYYLHIAFNLPPVWGPIQASVQNVITANALDWLRYAANCWIVWTADMPSEWAHRFNTQVVGLQDTSFLIIQVDIGSTSNGFASFPNWIWEWIRRPRY